MNPQWLEKQDEQVTLKVHLWPLDIQVASQLATVTNLFGRFIRFFNLRLAKCC